MIRPQLLKYRIIIFVRTTSRFVQFFVTDDPCGDVNGGVFFTYLLLWTNYGISRSFQDLPSTISLIDLKVKRCQIYYIVRFCYYEMSVPSVFTRLANFNIYHWLNIVTFISKNQFWRLNENEWLTQEFEFMVTR